MSSKIIFPDIIRSKVPTKRQIIAEQVCIDVHYVVAIILRQYNTRVIVHEYNIMIRSSLSTIPRLAFKR